MIFQDCIGADIRNDSLVMVYLKGSLRGLRPAACSLYSLESSQSLSEKLASVPALIADFEAEHHIRKTDIRIGIPQELTISREIVFPPAVKENLRAAVSYEMEKYIPLSAEDLYFDCQIIEENKARNRMRVLLLAAKKTSLAPYIACCRKLSGRICGMEGASTAKANVFAYVSKGKLQQKGREIQEEDILRKTGLPSAEYIPAFGLALQGLEPLSLRINLLPEDLRKRPGRFAYYMMILLAFLILLTALGWGGSYFLRQQQTVRELNKEMKQLRKEIAEMEDTQQQLEVLQTRINRLADLRQNHIPLLDIVRELTAIIPESAWVQDFSFSEKGIQINGFADSASELIGILEASPLFADVSFLSAIVKGRDGKERFSIGLSMEKLPGTGENPDE
ncbi:MAG: PilN domain-containing protein [Desulfococcaceae bacterium]|jgi:Tfp pilus assembly protein PilN|nr:PilN domain-containing protein [Desulfococcaceae bacterium]